MAGIPQVPKVEAENFSKIWKYRGISIPIDEAHIEFATDFANQVLRSFVIMCQENVKQALEAAKAKAEAVKPVIAE